MVRLMIDKELVCSFICTHCCCCFCLVTQLNPTLCDAMDCNTSGFLVLHHLPELAQTHVHWVGDAIEPSPHFQTHSMKPPSPQYQNQTKKTLKRKLQANITDEHKCKNPEQNFSIQCSCLENSRDRGPWWAPICGVAQSDTNEAT